MSVPPHDRLYTEFVQVGGFLGQLSSSDLLVAQRLSSAPDDDALFHAVVTRDKVLKIIEVGVASTASRSARTGNVSSAVIGTDLYDFGMPPPVGRSANR
jgi:hypothetical protein